MEMSYTNTTGVSKQSCIKNIVIILLAKTLSLHISLKISPKGAFKDVSKLL